MWYFRFSRGGEEHRALHVFLTYTVGRLALEVFGRRWISFQRGNAELRSNLFGLRDDGRRWGDAPFRVASMQQVSAVQFTGPSGRDIFP